MVETSEKLFQQAKTLMDSKDPSNWSRARSGPIKDYLAAYGARDNEQTQKM